MSHLPRVVVCAAIKLKNGLVICGVRHHDELMRGVALALAGGDFNLARESLAGHDEGFVDNDYKFLDRNQAWNVAKHAGQIHLHSSTMNGCLHSEDLY